MKLSTLTFDVQAKADLLDLFGKGIDSEGFIVEKGHPEQRVLTPNGEELHIKEWAGVMRGSESFIKGDANTLVELAKKLK